MKRFIAFILLINLLFVFGGFISVNTEKLSAIHIKTKYDFSSPDGKLVTFDYSPDLITTEHYTILREPYTTMSDTIYIRPDSDDSVSNGSIDTAYHYYVARNRDSKALYFKTLNETGKGTNIDSIINKYLDIPSRFYEALVKHPDEIEIKGNQFNDFFLETISVKHTALPNEPDSLAYYYRPSILKRSFKALRKDKKGDLYKVDILFRSMVVNGITIPRRSFNFEISKIQVPVPKTVKLVIEKFEREINVK